MEASPTGKPAAVRTKRVVTDPVAGIPAAPMLETVAVTLQSNQTSYNGFLKTTSMTS